MEKTKFILALLLLASCSTLTNKTTQMIPASAFDSVSLGSDSSSAESILGRPSEIRNTDKATEFWVYDNADEYHTQRGAVDVNHFDRRVVSVTVIPYDQDPEEKLDFLIKTKFAKSAFDKIRLQQCQRDYIPATVFYIDQKNGIVIRVEQNSNLVEYYSRVSPAGAAKMITDIKTCKF